MEKIEKVSIREASEILKVHENTIRSYIDKGILTAYQAVPGGKISLEKTQVVNLGNAKKNN